MSDAADRLALVVAQLMCRPGRAFAGQHPRLHQPHIAWAIRAGQYVMMTEAGSDRLLGFACWWLLEPDELALVRERGAEAILWQREPPRLDRGRHAHIAAAVTAPWAPAVTYRALVSLVKRTLSETETVAGPVESLSTVMAKRDGRRVWHERAVRGGEVCLGRGL